MTTTRRASLGFIIPAAVAAAVTVGSLARGRRTPAPTPERVAPSEVAVRAETANRAQFPTVFLIGALLSGAVMFTLGLLVAPSDTGRAQAWTLAGVISVAAIIAFMWMTAGAAARRARPVDPVFEVHRSGFTVVGRYIPWSQVSKFCIDDYRERDGRSDDVRLYVFYGSGHVVFTRLDTLVRTERVDAILDTIRAHAKARGIMVEEGGASR